MKSFSYQHQPIRTPLEGPERSLVIQLNGLFDEVYRRLGILSSLETIDVTGTGGSVIGHVSKAWDKCTVYMQGKSDTIPAAGITLPEKCKADADYFACCKYDNGLNNAVGILTIAEGTSVLKLTDLSGNAVSGTGVAGELTYAVRTLNKR